MKIDDREVEMDTPRSFRSQAADLGAQFDGHIAREFADRDVDATMETMVPEPYVYCVPVMTGGLRGRRRPPLLRRALHQSDPSRCDGDAHFAHGRQRPGR